MSPKVAKEADRFKELALQAKHILISSTLTSDGDSIGGQLGLYYLLVGLRGSEEGLYVIDHSPVPKRYRILHGTEKIMTLKDWQKKNPKVDFDLGVVCDGGIERTGPVAELFEPIKNTVLVDHHAIGSKLSYTSNILDLESSSTCETVYDLFERFNVPLSKEVAEALYVGIVFDTGFFKHSITSPKTHYIAARIISTGIDFSKISDHAILERSIEGQKLLTKLLKNAEHSSDGRVVVSYWSLDDLKEIKPEDGDQEGLINQLYYMQGSEVIALLTENEDGIVKMSFRSKGKINVAEFARSLTPDGGGHVRAAGCTVKGSLKDWREKVLKGLQELVSDTASN